MKRLRPVLRGLWAFWGGSTNGGTRVGQKATIGLLDMLGKGGEKLGREGRAMGGLFSYMNDDEDER